MNRRTYLKIGTMTAIATTFAVPSVFAKSGMLGKMGPDEFKKANETAGANVKAIKPDGKKLSDDDSKLLMEMAAGGMMQLELSKVAVAMGSSEDVKMIANAEVEEQTALAAKLKEVATGSGVTLPSTPDEKTRKMVDDLKEKKGLELDKAYLKESGIEGHEMLKKTMAKVSKEATSPTLKEIAGAAMPLIEVHLQVSKDEAADMA